MSSNFTNPRIAFTLLLKEGWVSHIENVKNRREQRISVTPSGWDMKAKILPVVQDVVKSATRGLSTEQIERNRQALNQIIINLID